MLKLIALLLQIYSIFAVKLEGTIQTNPVLPSLSGLALDSVKVVLNGGEIVTFLRPDGSFQV